MFERLAASTYVLVRSSSIIPFSPLSLSLSLDMRVFLLPLRDQFVDQLRAMEIVDYCRLNLLML